MLGELTGMGFGEARAVRALHHSGNSTVEGAVNWLTEHEADDGLDEPLLVPKARPCCGPRCGRWCPVIGALPLACGQPTEVYDAGGEPAGGA